MAIIDRIAVFSDGGTWEFNQIGAKASNITLENTINGSLNLENALSLLPSQSLINNAGKILSVTTDGKIGASGSDITTITNDIKTIKTNLNNLTDKNVASITRNGLKFTAKNADNEELFTFTQQDNNTTYAAATVAPVAIGIGGSAAVGSSPKYAREDHKHIIPASPAFTSPTASTMPSLGSTSNALVNAKYVTNYFTSIWNNTHYIVNQDIRRKTSNTTESFDAFGWITGEGKNLYIEVIVSKSYMKMDGTYLKFIPDKALINLRSGDDNKTYVVQANFNIKDLISNIYCDKEGVITIVCVRSTGWGVSNNSICAGNISLAGKWIN